MRKREEVQAVLSAHGPEVMPPLFPKEGHMQSEVKTELKPCPMCRHEVIEVEALGEDPADSIYRASCNGCDLRTKWCQTREQAIATWNRREDGEEERLREALQRIERWFGEFPMVDDPRGGKPVSYGVAYGSNGERDFMRAIARAALAGKGER
ncbi:MAG TPA: Lar family restriction alleviation protein [Prosthecobacter sp.]|nr:Lar family restriction alleviation protein [Prosthecobacter sp.]